jgi:hypothetical protein
VVERARRRALRDVIGGWKIYLSEEQAFAMADDNSPRLCRARSGGARCDQGGGALAERFKTGED